MTSRSTPGATVTKRIVCRVSSTHAAGLFSVRHAAIGAPNVSSATAPSKDSRNARVVFIIGILPPPAGRPRRFGRDPTDDTDSVDGADSLAESAARVTPVVSLRMARY